MAQFVSTRRGAGSVCMAAGLCVSCLTPMTKAQTGEQGPFVPTVGAMGITESMAQIIARDARNPKKWDGRYRWEADERREPDKSNAPSDPRAPAVPHWPWNFRGFNPPTVLPPSPLDNPQVVSPTQNFLATTISEGPGYVPPDSNGAVGPTEFVVFVNGRIKSFNKVTGAVQFSVDADVFFNSVRNGSTTSDPNVRYDPSSQRWFLTIINVANNSNRVLIARSTSSSATSSGAFTFFQFAQDTILPVGADTGRFLDYPSLGIDANALYIGGNMFTSGTGSFAGYSAWVVNKASVLGAGPLTGTAFRNIGVQSPRGVDNPDPAYAEGYIIGPDPAVFSRLVMRRITNPGGAPSISAILGLTVPTTVYPVDVATSGGSPAADTLDDRLFAAQVHKNRLTGQVSLLTAHNIQVTSTGVASNTGGRNGSRWYQIGTLTGTPSLLQSGTLFDSAAATPRSYWIPSITMTGQGHMAIGCSSAASNTQIGAFTAGRLSSDALGTIQSPSQMAAGAGAYTGNGGRFGDYSSTFVDPTDDQSLWTFQEYMSGNGIWGIRATKLLAPPPATPATAAPTSVTQGQTGVPIIITGTSAAGSGFYDTAPGFNRFQGAFSGTGITVTNIAFTDPTHVTLTVDVSAGAATGGRALTVTNPDGQQAASGPSILTVNTGSVCPGFSSIPGPVTVCDGSQAQFAVVATGSPAPTLVWRRNTIPLSDGGNISGANSATLTINPAGPADVGSYDCVATNTCGDATSTPAAPLTVGTAPNITGHSGDVTVYSGQPAAFSVTAPGTTGYQWRRNSLNLTDGGNISGATTATLSINPATSADAGTYDCPVSNSCGGSLGIPVTLTITPCYANCDQSTIAPILNVGDFACYLNAFAAGDPYANCDNSTTPPTLNVGDFACYLNAFAAGCT